MIFPHLEYINRLQAELTVINRHHNNVLAFTKTIRNMYAHTPFRTFDYTRTIEDEREVPKDLQSNEDSMLLFGDIYE